MDVSELEEIQRNTRALLGEEKDVSYITETLLADMERNGVHISPRSDSEQTYYGCRIVDAVRYVAFQTKADKATQDCDETRIAWIEKPLEISQSGYCEGAHLRYAISKLHTASSMGDERRR